MKSLPRSGPLTPVGGVVTVLTATSTKRLMLARPSAMATPSPVKNNISCVTRHKVYVRSCILSNPCATDEGQGRSVRARVRSLQEAPPIREDSMDAATPVVADLDAMVDVAEQGIVSKAIVENEHHKIIHFTLAAGQELSEHTASVPAVIHVLQGRGDRLAGRGGARGSAGDALLHAGRAQARRRGATATSSSCSRCSGREADGRRGEAKDGAGSAPRSSRVSARRAAGPG